LESRFGPVLDEEEMDALACSLARQWRKYGGVASLFVEGDQVLFFFQEESDERCGVRSKRQPTEIESLLHSLGFAPEVVPEVIARLNLDQEIQFKDRQGVPSILWHDPKSSRIRVRALDALSPEAPTRSPPIFCPKCTALLSLWRAGERQQTCPQCGLTASF